MTEKDIRNHIKLFIKKMIQDGELEENMFHATTSNQNVVTAVQDKIENVFSGYSEKDKTFTPQKVIEKTY